MIQGRAGNAGKDTNLIYNRGYGLYGISHPGD